MDLARILLIFLLLLTGTIVQDADAQNYSALSARIHYHGGEDSIPAGTPGRFRVSIDNGGPDTSTNTRVWFAWFRSGLAGTTSHSYTARPSQGICSPVHTPDPDCYLDMISVGGTATIEVEGQTDPGRLSWYTLRVWVESDQAAKTMLAEFSKGSSVTIAESGGGSFGWPLIVAMLAIASIRRRGLSRQG